MRIGIDAHGMGGESLSAGNTVFVSNLLKELSVIDQKNDYTIYIGNPEANENEIFNRQNFTSRLIRPGSQWIQRSISLPLEIIRSPVDILHVPFVAPPFCSSKVIITIHDVCFEQYPEFYTRLERLRMSLLVRLSAKRATKVITVSNSAREDIIKLYKMDTAKVQVVYNGVDTNFFTPITNMNVKEIVRKKYGINGRYILFVGTIQPRKNLFRLLHAFARLNTEIDFDYKLVIAGKEGWLSRELFREVSKLNLKEKIVFTGYVADSELPFLYNAAELFVYPSIAEGFGIPPIEAMACGTPVVASNIPCMQEILGEAAIMVDPFNIEDICEGIHRLLSDEHLSNENITRGLKRVQNFNWQDSSRKLLSIYEEVI